MSGIAGLYLEITTFSSIEWIVFNLSCVYTGPVAWLGGRPAPGVIILGWHHIMMWIYKLHRFVVNTFLFSFCLVPILIWTKYPLIFRQRSFFSGGLHLFLVRKRVPLPTPPRVPPFLATPQHWRQRNAKRKLATSLVVAYVTCSK